MNEAMPGDADPDGQGEGDGVAPNIRWMATAATDAEAPRDAVAERLTGNLALTALIFVGGISSLGAEIAATRLLAPYFGASTIVWANTIGVVLVALSIGYWIGGRLADKRPRERDLRMLALGAAVMVAVIPLAAGPFLELSVTAFDKIDAGAFFGSLAGVMILVAVPVILLGAISPWAIRLAITEVSQAGQVTGRLYAISTIGSLLGTFLSALVLIPLIGSQRTFLTFAAALALVAVIGLPKWAWIVPIVLAALLALPPGVTKPSSDGIVLHEEETTYQYARVIEDQGGDRRVLELNEGQAYHSIWRRNSVLTGGVWDGYLVLPFARLQHPPATVAMLGNAAGTVSRAYEEFFPETAIDGVEIDPKISELGRKYFDMNNPRLTVHDRDARPFLRATDKHFDLIGIDAYRQPYIPFYLTTTEFFGLVKDRLTPPGAVIVNVGHPEDSQDLEKVIAAGLREHFNHVLAWDIEDTNTLLIAADEPTSAARLRASEPELPLALRPIGVRAAAELRPAATGGAAYTDDKAPVEWLIDRSIIEYAAGEDE
jgi:spermidine synthase